MELLEVDCWQCAAEHFGLSFVCGGQHCDSVGNCGYRLD